MSRSDLPAVAFLACLAAFVASAGFSAYQHIRHADGRMTLYREDWLCTRYEAVSGAGLRVQCSRWDADR